MSWQNSGSCATQDRVGVGLEDEGDGVRFTDEELRIVLDPRDDSALDTGFSG